MASLHLQHRSFLVKRLGGRPGYANCSRSLNLSGGLASFSLYGPSINYCLALHLGYQFADVTTAAIMYFFGLAALLIGSWQMRFRASWSLGVGLTMAALFAISAIWVVNYVDGYNSLVELTPYDYKRPAFAFYGIVIFGLLGIFASRDPIVFLRGFLGLSIINSVILAVLYLFLYDSGSELSRIGGDAGLIIGILLSQGVTSILVMLWLGWLNYRSVLLLILIMIAAIIMSGTRSALLAVTSSLFLWVVMKGRRLQISKIAAYSWVPIACGLFLYFVADVIPESTIQRVTNYNLEGSEDRWALLLSAWNIFVENPLGKTVGYVGLFPAEIEYSHNATVQIILECGVISIGFIVFLLFCAVRAVVVNCGINRRVLRGFLFYAIGVYLVSLSAGDAYNPQYWFVTTLLAASGFHISRRSTWERNEHCPIQHPI